MTILPLLLSALMPAASAQGAGPAATPDCAAFAAEEKALCSELAAILPEIEAVWSKPYEIARRLPAIEKAWGVVRGSPAARRKDIAPPLAEEMALISESLEKWPTSAQYRALISIAPSPPPRLKDALEREGARWDPTAGGNAGAFTTKDPDFPYLPPDELKKLCLLSEASRPQGGPAPEPVAGRDAAPKDAESAPADLNGLFDNARANRDEAAATTPDGSEAEAALKEQIARLLRGGADDKTRAEIERRTTEFYRARPDLARARKDAADARRRKAAALRDGLLPDGTLVDPADAGLDIPGARLRVGSFNGAAGVFTEPVGGDGDASFESNDGRLLVERRKDPKTGARVVGERALRADGRVERQIVSAGGVSSEIEYVYDEDGRLEGETVRDRRGKEVGENLFLGAGFDVGGDALTGLKQIDFDPATGQPRRIRTAGPDGKLLARTVFLPKNKVEMLDVPQDVVRRGDLQPDGTVKTTEAFIAETPHKALFDDKGRLFAAEIAYDPKTGAAGLETLAAGGHLTPEQAQILAQAFPYDAIREMANPAAPAGYRPEFTAAPRVEFARDGAGPALVFETRSPASGVKRAVRYSLDAKAGGWVLFTQNTYADGKSDERIELRKGWDAAAGSFAGADVYTTAWMTRYHPAASESWTVEKESIYSQWIWDAAKNDWVMTASRLPEESDGMLDLLSKNISWTFANAPVYKQLGQATGVIAGVGKTVGYAVTGAGGKVIGDGVYAVSGDAKKDGSHTAAEDYWIYGVVSGYQSMEGWAGEDGRRALAGGMLKDLRDGLGERRFREVREAWTEKLREQQASTPGLDAQQLFAARNATDFSDEQLAEFLLSPAGGLGFGGAGKEFSRRAANADGKAAAVGWGLASVGTYGADFTFQSLGFAGIGAAAKGLGVLARGGQAGGRLAAAARMTARGAELGVKGAQAVQDVYFKTLMAGQGLEAGVALSRGDSEKVADSLCQAAAIFVVPHGREESAAEKPGEKAAPRNPLKTYGWDLLATSSIGKLAGKVVGEAAAPTIVDPPAKAPAAPLPAEIESPRGPGAGRERIAASEFPEVELKTYGNGADKAYAIAEAELARNGGKIEGVAGSYASGKARVKPWPKEMTVEGKTVALEFDDVSMLDKMPRNLTPEALARLAPRVRGLFELKQKMLAEPGGMPSDLDVIASGNAEAHHEIARTIFEKTGVYVEFVEPFESPADASPRGIRDWLSRAADRLRGKTKAPEAVKPTPLGPDVTGDDAYQRREATRRVNQMPEILEKTRRAQEAREQEVKAGKTYFANDVGGADEIEGNRIKQGVEGDCALRAEYYQPAMKSVREVFSYESMRALTVKLAAEVARGTAEPVSSRGTPMEEIQRIYDRLGLTMTDYEAPDSDTDLAAAVRAAKGNVHCYIKWEMPKGAGKGTETAVHAVGIKRYIKLNGSYFFVVDDPHFSEPKLYSFEDLRALKLHFGRVEVKTITDPATGQKRPLTDAEIVATVRGEMRRYGIEPAKDAPRDDVGRAETGRWRRPAAEEPATVPSAGKVELPKVDGPADGLNLVQTGYGYDKADAGFTQPMGRAVESAKEEMARDFKAGRRIPVQRIRALMDQIAETRRQISRGKNDADWMKFGASIPESKEQIPAYMERGGGYIPSQDLTRGYTSDLVYKDAPGRLSRHNKYYDTATKIYSARGGRGFAAFLGKIQIDGQTFETSYLFKNSNVIDGKNYDYIEVRHPDFLSMAPARQKALGILETALNDPKITEATFMDRLAQAYQLMVHATPYVRGSPAIIEGFYDAALRAKFGKTLPHKSGEPFWDAMFWDPPKPYTGRQFLSNFQGEASAQAPK